jgi:ATP-dependent Clp protease ATP-binding subunit ClpC
MVETRLSQEALKVYRLAGEIAKGSSRPLNSTHLLLAMFTVPCEAQAVLLEKKVGLDELMARIPLLTEIEPEGQCDRILETAMTIAANFGAFHVTTVHLLIAITKIPDCLAAILIQKTGLSLGELRTHSIAHVTDPRLKRSAAEKMMRLETYEFKKDIFQTHATKPVVKTETVTETEDEDEPIEFGDEDEFLEEVVPDEHEEEGEWRFALDRKEFPALCAYGKNLTLLAEKGEIDPLIGRERELEAIIDILSKRNANNPLLLGDPGVGKTRLVEGLAMRIVQGKVSSALKDKVIISLSVSDLLAGTSMRGAFAQRLKAIKDEVLKAKRRIILFIDEIHTLVGAGVGDGALDAANDLKGPLARGEFPCIGATTYGEYQRSIQQDVALDRRFEKVYVREPDADEALEIIEGLAPSYEAYHQVKFTQEAKRAAVFLSDRFIWEKSLPAKAIDILDRAGARARREKKEVVEESDIVKTLSSFVNIPETILKFTAEDAFRVLEPALLERIVGHKDNLLALCTSLAKNLHRFGSRKPLGVFLFAGPKGVGKKTIAKVLASALFGSEQAFVEIDLSDFSEAHSISQLIGSPPGYVGHEEGSMLSDLLTRRPFLVFFWRHIEQAHSAVLGLLSQIFSDGNVTDRRGKRMDFRNTIHIVTVETPESSISDVRMGFKVIRSEGIAKEMRGMLKKYMPMDFIGLFDQVMMFSPLAKHEIKAISKILFDQMCKDFEAHRGIRVVIDESSLERLLSYVSKDAKDASQVHSRLEEVAFEHILDIVARQSQKTKISLRLSFEEGDEKPRVEIRDL